jgi:hypothetical protein
MTDEIYDHMPKWRRLIRDLAREAGIKSFQNPSRDKGNESGEERNSSVLEDRSDESAGAR